MTRIAENYLKENVDSNVRIVQWGEREKLPLFLKNSYLTYEMSILGHACVLLEAVATPQGMGTIEKHIRRFQEFTKRDIVLYYRSLTRYRRRTLIENRIPFIIEDGQIYLPFLGLDLKSDREDQGSSVYTAGNRQDNRIFLSPKDSEKDGARFSATTQQAFLHFLYHEDLVVNTTEFSEKAGLTVMTASRVLNDLYDARLLTYEIGGKTGRSKIYRRIKDPEYFERGREFFRTPVRWTVYVNTIPEGALVAGLEALATRSMLNAPDHPVRAISRHQVNQENLEILDNMDIIRDGQLIELQIWDYDPAVFSDNQIVDPVSLYASLKNEGDERVVQALWEVLRGEKWYMD